MISDVLPMVLAMAAIAARALVGLIFVQAAVGKIRHWAILEGVLRNYRILPPFLAQPAAVLLPMLELAVGALLLVHPGFLGALLGAGLLLAFAIAMGVNIVRGRTEIDCGCFQSDLRQTLDWRLVGRNLVLSFLLIVPALGPDRTAAPWMLAEGYVAGVVLLALYGALDSLLATGPKLRRWAYPEEALS
jgi:hypothetical protein